MNNDFATLKKQPRVFSGLDALVLRLRALVICTEDLHINNELNAVITELRLLDSCLNRIRYERTRVDERDVDQAIDRLRSLQQEGW